MNLSEWSNQTGILPTTPTTEKGAVSVVIDQGHPERAKLYHLTDYKVSTSSGVVWLVPSVPKGWDKV